MKKWLLNPFDFIAGWTSLIAGVVIISLTALVCSLGSIHLDGAIDMHHGTEAVPLATAFAESLIDWLCIGIFFYIAGLIFSPSSIRPLDVFGTQALARFPVLINAGVLSLINAEKTEQYIEWKFMHKGEAVEPSNFEWFSWVMIALVTIVIMIWMIVLMYRAYSVSCNIRGTKGVLSFIGALLVAEIISKILINFL